MDITVMDTLVKILMNVRTIICVIKMQSVRIPLDFILAFVVMVLLETVPYVTISTNAMTTHRMNVIKRPLVSIFMGVTIVHATLVFLAMEHYVLMSTNVNIQTCAIQILLVTIIMDHMFASVIKVFIGMVYLVAILMSVPQKDIVATTMLAASTLKAHFCARVN